MPFQVGRCEACGYGDHVDYVDARPHGAWLCKYCRESLYEDGELELENGEKIVKDYSINFIGDIEDKDGIAKVIEDNIGLIRDIQKQLRPVRANSEAIDVYAEVVADAWSTPMGDVELVLRIGLDDVGVVERLIRSQEGMVEETLLASVSV